MALGVLILISAQFSCNSEEDSLQSEVPTDNAEHPLDSVAQRTDPRTLDLTKPQFFIDTTRTWPWYEKLRNFKVEETLLGKLKAEMIANANVSAANLKETTFPNFFIQLNKKNGTYLLYDRCDGMDVNLYVKDSLFVVFGPLERSVYRIEEIIHESKDAIEFKVASWDTDQLQAFVKIERIEKEVYTLTSEVYPNNLLLTVPDAVNRFEMLINHCPNEKAFEYNFD